ncbi:hypothetical protein JFU47_12250 [Pseudomonas sp. TH39(2020)]|uniref:hypothetical protein n=1 Tax=Pseudomonas sp. TH39(2020) TaxID=2796349 RepID=UPI001914038F|nr:hypothetical protein [Pseudomonas sp. TH39(2020)]MBK5397468.1 hypothetical protein [Pseudomonas sp. TH39(2020)]
MSTATTEMAVENKADRLTAKAWVYIVGAMGVGMLLGAKLISPPLQAQIDGWKEMAGDWKLQAQDYKTASEQNAGYAKRWELEANNALALVARCTSPSTGAH